MRKEELNCPCEIISMKHRHNKKGEIEILAKVKNPKDWLGVIQNDNEVNWEI